MPVRPPTDDERKALGQHATDVGVYVKRVPVIDGRVAVRGEVQPGGKLWDDHGRELVGSVALDGSVTLEEPTDRRIFWAGRVKR